ncbi:MAG: hypothetical protein A2W31_13650 [Planctomycetes bacterium RBG_16_64_10]|nr:MAG: hypothetical protein A2W31_13650 [Planctomycetes bacterium RBG_16_64_10]
MPTGRQAVLAAVPTSEPARAEPSRCEIPLAHWSLVGQEKREGTKVERNWLISVWVFCLLVVVGVTGRLLEPAWCFTPLAAVAIFSGYFFANRSAAMLVPLTIMAISDVWLPAYRHPGVMAVVYVALVAPVSIGWALQRRTSLVRLGVFSLLPAVVFFLTTNLAVWRLEAIYPHTPAGLLACYGAAVPFFRTMLAGDVFYVAVVFGGYALAAGWAGGLVATDRARRLINPLA